jgi:hypothetical protein
MNIKVISFFSPRYAVHANHLRESCKRWSVDADITPVKEFQSWWHGVTAKPRFIAQQLDTFSNYDGVLWVDADAYFVRPVPWGDLVGDVACTRFQWSPAHRLEHLTGTMFFATNNRVRVLVSDWSKETAKLTASDTPEQDALAPLLAGWRHSISFTPLNIEWTWIDDERVKEQFPMSIPLIMHKQASRQIRAEEFRKSQAKP